ncbi:MAG: hypothetical protein JW927_17530 [Deltaproteobacteria bacterium]|nr:hypothetical protein [Deltaproteobacteria bacterium]
MKLILPFLLSILILMLSLQHLYADDTPALPMGLGGASQQSDNSDQPGLPAGLGPAVTQESADDPMPSLPQGLGARDNVTTAPKQAPETKSFLASVTGFIEARGGMRLNNDPYEKDTSLGELRLQFKAEKQLGRFLIRNSNDIYYDAVAEERSVHLEKGKGFIDLRELSLSFSALDNMDIKAGRQILTWGTGDLVFINDLFPKDWQSFLLGRDTEYLKAPSDAVKASIYTEKINMDIVFMPKFDPDRFITGERLSYWNGYRTAGRDSIINAERPNNWLNDYELAVRFSKNINGNEIAFYGYHGYWKSPGGIDPFTFRYIFPELNVYGASIRGQAGRGIGNIEAGYYDSRDDSNGDNPFINNSQIRFLVGYEQDLPMVASDLTAGLQYYLEHMMDHDEYLDILSPGSPAADEDRHLFTLRITKLLLNQNLTCSLFTYYSPSDQDLYIRPNISYKFTDDWKGEVGANIFSGECPHTFFGQFHENTNVFIAVRYNY